MRRRKKIESENNPWTHQVAILDDDDEPTGDWETCRIVKVLDDETVEIICKDDEDEIITVESCHIREKKKKKKRRKKKKTKEDESKSDALEKSSENADQIISETKTSIPEPASIIPQDTKSVDEQITRKEETKVAKEPNAVKSEALKDENVIEPVIKENNQEIVNEKILEEAQEEEVEAADDPVANIESPIIPLENNNQQEDNRDASASEISEAANNQETEERELDVKEPSADEGLKAEVKEEEEMQTGDEMDNVKEMVSEVQNHEEEKAAENVEDCREDPKETESEATPPEDIDVSRKDSKAAQPEAKLSEDIDKVQPELNSPVESEVVGKEEEVEALPENAGLEAIKHAVKEELEILEAEAAQDQEVVQSVNEEENKEMKVDEPVEEVTKAEQDEAKMEVDEPAKEVEESKVEQPEKIERDIIQEKEMQVEELIKEVGKVEKDEAKIEVDEPAKEVEESKVEQPEKFERDVIQEPSKEVEEVKVEMPEEVEEEIEAQEVEVQEQEVLENHKGEVEVQEPEVQEPEQNSKVDENADREEEPQQREIKVQDAESFVKDVQVNHVEVQQVEVKEEEPSKVEVEEIVEVRDANVEDAPEPEIAVKEVAENKDDIEEVAKQVAEECNTEVERFTETDSVNNNDVQESRAKHIDEVDAGAELDNEDRKEEEIENDESTDTEVLGGEVQEERTEEDIKEYAQLSRDQMTATSRPYLEYVYEVEVLEDGKSTDTWLPCNIVKQNSDGSYDIKCDGGIVHYISAGHVRTVQIQWTHEVLEIADGEVEWLRCIILEGEAGESKVKIHVENQILNKEVRKDKLKPIEMYWTHDMAVIRDFEPTGDWLHCTILAQHEEGSWTVQCEDGCIWDEVSHAMLRPTKKDWTHEYQVRRHGVQTDQWRQCIILNEEDGGQAATVHTDEGLIEIVDVRTLRSLQAEEIIYTHKVATFTEDGDTADWWPCLIKEVLDDGRVVVQCEDGELYEVRGEDVLSMHDAPKQSRESDESQILKLQQSPSNKAWYSTVSLVTVRGYDGKMYEFPEETRVLITDFEGETVKIEKPVYGWTHLYGKDNRFSFKYEEDWVKSVLSAKTWYDVFGEVKTRILDYSASFESSRIIEPTKYEVTGSNGCTIREEYSLNSPKIEKLQKGAVIEIVEMKGRRARILRPREGWISMHSTEGIWFIEKVEEGGDSEPEEQSDEEADITVESSVAGLDEFEDSDDPEYMQLKKDWLVLKQANILQNRQLVLKDKKLLQLKKKLKSSTRQTYGVHSNFWEELETKKRRRAVIQREIRSKSEINEKLKKKKEQLEREYAEKQDILNKLIEQRDKLRARLADDKLRQETALAEHLWKHKYGALEDGLKHLTDQKMQLEECQREMSDEIQAKRGTLKALQDARIEFSKKAENAKTELANNQARIQMASSWRKQLRRKLRGLRKVRAAQLEGKPSSPVSPAISEGSLGAFPLHAEPMPSEI